jgi:hypothetical protein
VPNVRQLPKNRHYRVRRWIGGGRLRCDAVGAGAWGWTSAGLCQEHTARDLPVPYGRCQGRQSACRVLKRWRGMSRALIFDSSVCRGRPSLAAAPEGPDTRPRHSANAASIRVRSCAARAATKDERKNNLVNFRVLQMVRSYSSIHHEIRTV